MTMYSSATLRLGGAPPPAMKTLGGIFLAALLVFVFWGSPVYSDTLGLVPRKAFGGLQLWRVVTAPLWLGTLTQVRIAPLVLSVLGLLLFGAPLERWLGTGRVGVIFAAAAVMGHLGAALLGLAVAPDTPLGGPAPGVWGIATALCIHYWHLPVVIVRPLPIQGRHLAYGLGAALLIALLGDLADGLSALPFLADGLGCAVAALIVTRGWRPWRRGSGRRSRFVLIQGGRRGDFGVRPGGGGRGGNGGGGNGSGGNGRSPGGPPRRGGGPRTWN